jgi:hypothetical protein
LPELTGSDRRRFPRFAAPPDASVRLRPDVVARLLDLGVGGALVESPLRLIPGSVTPVVLCGFGLDFQAKALIHRSSISGFVRSVQGERAPLYRVGLEFATLSPSEVSAVKALVDRAAQIGNGKKGKKPVPNQTPRIVAPFPTTTPTTKPRPSQIEPDPLSTVQFPPGWVVDQKMSVRLAKPPSGRGFLVVSVSPRPHTVDLCEFAQASMEDAGLKAMHCRPAEINGNEASVGFYSGWLDPLGAVIVEAAHVVLDGQTYLIAGIASWTAYETMRNEFFATINSFGRALAADRNLTSEGSKPGARLKGDGSKDMRQHVRVPGPFDGIRVGMLETPIRVYDLSEGGCFIGSLHDTAPGQRLGIRIQLPQEGLITLNAEALYERPGFGYAVRFVEVADHVQASLNRVVHRTYQRIRSQESSASQAERRSA